MKMCAQRKAGRAAICTLPMVPCGLLWSPVTRFALSSAMWKTKRLRRRLDPNRNMGRIQLERAPSYYGLGGRGKAPFSAFAIWSWKRHRATRKRSFLQSLVLAFRWTKGVWLAWIKLSLAFSTAKTVYPVLCTSGCAYSLTNPLPFPVGGR